MPSALPVVISLVLGAAPTGDAPPPAYQIGVHAGVGWRLPPASREVPPRFGPSFGTRVTRIYARAGGLELGVAASFAYERYARSVQATTMTAPGQEVAFDSTRRFSHFDFALAQTASLNLGRAHPWVAAGAGLGLAHFLTRETALRPGEARATRPLVQGTAGFDWDFKPDTSVGLAFQYTHLLGTDSFQTEAGPKLALFGARMALRLGLLYRF